MAIGIKVINHARLHLYLLAALNQADEYGKRIVY